MTDMEEQQGRPPAPMPSSSNVVRGLTITVALRRQTPEEERYFGDAVKIFLAEVVRKCVRQD